MKDVDSLSRWIKQEKQLSGSICYYYIGKAFYKFYKDEDKSAKKEDLLQQAKKYLIFAADNMSRSHIDIYQNCHKLLIQAECQSQFPELDTIIRYIKHVPELNSSDNSSNLEILTKAINDRLRSYNTDISVLDDPSDYIQLAQRLGIHTPEIQQTSNIFQLKQSYHEKVNHFRATYNYEEIQNIIALLNQMQRYNLQNIHTYMEAFSSLKKYYMLTTNDYSSADNQCNSYRMAFDMINKASRELGYIQDTQHAECASKRACLNAQMKSNIRDQLLSNHMIHGLQENNQWHMWLDELRSARKGCPGIKIAEDQQSVLIEYQSFTEALDSYERSEYQSIRQLKRFFAKVNNEHLINLSGGYLAVYYQKKIFNELMRGPFNKPPLEALNEMKNDLNDFEQFSNYREYRPRNQQLNIPPINLLKEHGLLTQFFKAISNNPDDAQVFVQQMDDSILEAWEIQERLLKAINQTKAKPPRSAVQPQPQYFPQQQPRQPEASQQKVRQQPPPQPSQATLSEGTIGIQENVDNQTNNRQQAVPDYNRAITSPDDARAFAIQLSNIHPVQCDESRDTLYMFINRLYEVYQQSNNEEYLMVYHKFVHHSPCIEKNQILLFDKLFGK